MSKESFFKRTRWQEANPSGDTSGPSCLWGEVLRRAIHFSPETSPSPEGTHHVQMTRASLRVLTTAEPCCRAPLGKLSLFMYKGQPAAAPAKAMPKTSLFDERGPGRHNPMKETSPDASAVLPRRRLSPCGTLQTSSSCDWS